MAGVVVAAFLIGLLGGLFARPLLDAYLHWKWARMWAQMSSDEAALFDETQFQHPAP